MILYDKVYYNAKRIQYNLGNKLINLCPKNNYYIFSEPRGGSTWLAEMIGSLVNRPILWEPLNEKEVKVFNELALPERLVLAPDQSASSKILIAVQKAFKGKVLNKWTTEVSSLQSLLSNKQAVVKICKGNGILPWILKHFKFNYEPIYLVRSPYAVISSQLEHVGWEKGYETIKFPKEITNTIYDRYQPFLKSLKNKEEVLTAYWCISNKAMLSGSFDESIIKIYYEDLARTPRLELDKIFNRWGIGYKLNKNSELFNKASYSASKDLTSNTEKQLNKWKSKLSQKEIKNITRVLRAFEISFD
jgi:hypothetical protein